MKKGDGGDEKSDSPSKCDILTDTGKMRSNPLERITMSKDICHGKPCIRNLRYPVTLILELLSSGMTREDILEDYLDLESEDLAACLFFAARLTQTKSIIQLAS